MAIESTSLSPASVKTDEVAFLEAARALLCLRIHIGGNCFKPVHKVVDLGGGAPVLSVLLTSPLVITCLHCHSSASLRVPGGTSFDAAPASNGFKVTIGFGFGFHLVGWTGGVTRYWLGPNTLCEINGCPGQLSFDAGISHSRDSDHPLDSISHFQQWYICAWQKPLKQHIPCN